MLTVYPDYYPDFKCIADKCRHSCCKDWEIDIDDVSLLRFRRIPFISQHIVEESGVSCFRLKENGMCPFLKDNGLCELIIRYGEDMLCDICADHPRFRNYLSDRVEIGLGLSCEAATELILTRQDPQRFMVRDDDEPSEALTEDEAYILSFRDAMILALQDRTIPVAVRIDRILREADCALPNWSGAQLYAFLLSLECLDPHWQSLLTPLCEYPGLPKTESTQKTELMLEQLAVYLVYRHILPAAEDDDLCGRMLLCAFLWKLADALVAIHGIGAFIEVCRLLSSELEYSDENLQLIIEALR